MKIKFVPYERSVRSSKKYSYEKFVGIVKLAVKQEMPAVAVKWSDVQKLVGFTSKPHSVFARKKHKLFRDKEGNEYSIEDIEQEFKIKLVGNRDKNLMAIIKQ